MNAVQSESRSQLTPKSDDVTHLDQLIARIVPEDQEKIGPAFDTIKALRAYFYGNDCRSAGRHLDREIWLRMRRMVILDFGHQVDNVRVAQLLCHKNMLVLDHGGVPGHFQSLHAYGLFSQTPNRSVYSGLAEATITCNRGVFEEQLKSNSFTSVMVFGTQTFSNELEDKSGLIEMIYQHVQGDLPRIFIIG